MPWLERETVPKEKEGHFSRRENSEYKWQKGHGIIGALEIPSEPILNVQGEYTEHGMGDQQKDVAFSKALEIWEERKLKGQLIKACEIIPPETCCCGWIPDDDNTKKAIVKNLNRGFLLHLNTKLKEDGLKLDAYEWSWDNPTGKSKTIIVLIRFFELHN